MSKKMDKWKGVPITEANVDEYLNDLANKSSGQYIIQGVSFNKNDAFQMALLRQALISSSTFSGFIKHLLAVHFNSNNYKSMQYNPVINNSNVGMVSQPTLQQAQQAQQIQQTQQTNEITVSKESVDNSELEQKTFSSIPTTPTVKDTQEVVTPIVKVGSKNGEKKVVNKNRNINAQNFLNAFKPNSN
jgi:hypothetical protein